MIAVRVTFSFGLGVDDVISNSKIWQFSEPKKIHSPAEMRKSPKNFLESIRASDVGTFSNESRNL